MKDLQQPDPRQPVDSMSVDGARVYPGKSIYDMAAEKASEEYRRAIDAPVEWSSAPPAYSADERFGRASMRRDILAILQRHGVGEEVMDEVRRCE